MSLIADRFHPIANLFPLLVGEAFEALTDDIRAHGLRQPIVEYEGLILDGRNRYGACLRADREPRFVTFAGDDPVAFVLSANLQRRHLDESQRAMVATALASLPRGAHAQICAASQAGAAEKLNVSRRAVQHAKVVRTKGIAALVQRVEQGEIAVSVAAQIAGLPRTAQAALVDQPEAKLRSAVKRQTRAQRERALAARTARAACALGTTLYAVIYADPPWRFEPYARDTGLDRAADNHYPTMELAAICALTPPAAPDCALFLWTTVPMYREALAVIDAWGFTYKSHYIWLKDQIGTGYWNRCRHELLLVATKGNVPAPAPGEQYESVIAAPLGPHSEKPIAFAEMIEDLFPNNRLLEMFARSRRAGWDVWGNEA
jgi:N6-adenosine-specific RNA methylase IME4